MQKIYPPFYYRHHPSPHHIFIIPYISLASLYPYRCRNNYHNIYICYYCLLYTPSTFYLPPPTYKTWCPIYTLASTIPVEAILSPLKNHLYNHLPSPFSTSFLSFISILLCKHLTGRNDLVYCVVKLHVIPE